MIRPDSLYKKQETDINESMSAPTGQLTIPDSFLSWTILWVCSQLKHKVV